tara:strand:- start:299 stop:667 length:369 start_codon:yes stop_codon:yes gene_type:complete
MKQYIKKIQNNILIIENILTNKYFIGIFMIIINIGSRFIIEELSPEQRKWINNNHIVRRLFVFCILFIATKDLIASIILTILFIFIIGHLFNTSTNIDIEQIEIDKKKILNDVETSLNKNLG